MPLPPFLSNWLKQPIDNLVEYRKAKWPEPRLSLGTAFGPTQNPRVFYWQAIGPALTAFRELLPKIEETLVDKLGPTSNTDYLSITLYMVGKCEDNAYPCIMFASEWSTQRIQAVEHVKASGILGCHPGFQAGHWPEAPHIGRQTVKAGFATDHDTFMQAVRARREDTGDTRRQLEMPKEVSFQSGFSETRPVHVRFLFESRMAEATAGMAVLHEGNQYFLLPAHVLVPPRSAVAAGPEAQASVDDQIYDFGDLQDEEDSVEDATGHVTSYLQDENDSMFSLQNVEDSTEDATTLSGRVEAKAEAKSQQAPFQSVGDADTERSFCKAASISLDYVLCRVAWPRTLDVNDQRAASDFARWKHVPPIQHSLDAMERLRLWGLLPIRVQTVRGDIFGQMSSDPAVLRLPFSTCFQPVFHVSLLRPVQDGDSGARVYPYTGTTDLGHIITGNAEKRTAYVMLSTCVRGDIEDQPWFGLSSDADKPVVVVPNHERQGDEPRASRAVPYGNPGDMLTCSRCGFEYTAWQGSCVQCGQHADEHTQRRGVKARKY